MTKKGMIIMYIHNMDSSLSTIIENYRSDVDYIYSKINNDIRNYAKDAEPTYSCSVYTNANTQNAIMVLDRSGMLTTVNYLPSINAKAIADRIGDVDRSNKTEKTRGVYVVREWNIKTFRGRLAYSNMSLLDYYNNIESYIKLSDSEMDILKHKLSELNSGTGRYSGTNDIKIRSISYIPLSKLNEYKVVYDKHSDLLFSIDGIDKDVMHPSSCRYGDTYETYYENSKLDVNIIEIELIDSHTRGKKYFSMLGNDTVMLRSRHDKQKPDGAEVYVTSGGVRKHGYTVSRDNLESVGIYDSEEKAKTNGDVKLGVELSKLSLEYSKIEQQVRTLEHAKFKMEKEKENILNKHKHELEIANIKIKSALFDYHKLAKIAIIEIKTKMVDLKFKQVDHMTKHIEGIEKHNREMSLLEYKTAIEADKQQAKTYNTVLDTVLKYGGALLK